MKLARLSAAASALSVVAIQFVKPETSNPSLPPERSIAARADLPRPVALALDRACADCHSNETRWPWYSRSGRDLSAALRARDWARRIP